MQYWILKTEPATYSWDTFLKEKKTFWNGVRNYQARNNLSKMKVGDLCFFYHSGEERRIMGVAKVTREAHPDNLTDDIRWVMVDVEPVKPLRKPVSLSLIKEVPELQHIKLVRQSRLSVSELSKEEFNLIETLGN
ncbi:MAG: EVE domain-containing protein [Candidatus Peregrinibacteria bacterium]|nr:EVE domain-containing protein [Candidatus Peregrinibacteria bacterium]